MAGARNPFVWYELMTSDVDSAKAFYANVVGWTTHCDLLPSILDLMSSSCRTRETPTAITAGDLAFLKGLYYRNTGLGPSLSRDDIEDNMMRQFNRR